jgi:hypothetical protein
MAHIVHYTPSIDRSIERDPSWESVLVAWQGSHKSTQTLGFDTGAKDRKRFAVLEDCNHHLGAE